MAVPTSSKQLGRTDLELVLLVRKGDTEAFSVLVRRYHERIYNTVFGLVGEPDDADDLAQEVFLKAYRSLPGFKGKSRFYTWLYRIAVNCCLDWIKSPVRQRPNLSLEREIWEGKEELRQPRFTDERVQQRELKDMLDLALQNLPDEYRVTLVLREFDGLTYEEIADLLSCQVGTVKSRLFRARTRLREILENDYKAWFGA